MLFLILTKNFSLNVLINKVLYYSYVGTNLQVNIIGKQYLSSTFTFNTFFLYIEVNCPEDNSPMDKYRRNRPATVQNFTFSRLSIFLYTWKPFTVD